MKINQYGSHQILRDDIKLVNKVLRSNFLTQGPFVEKFENTFSKKVKCKFSSAVNSGTAALHLACIALGLKKSDIFWTTPISFVASANCGLMVGAKIDFVDIDTETGNISIDLLKKKLQIAKKNNKLPKIIIIVHFAGNPVNMKKIYKLSKNYKFKIIEDACHALGGKIDNYPVGSCRYSNITTFSFHPVKNITSAEGGMICSNNKKIKKQVDLYRTHGIKKNVDKKVDLDKGWFYKQYKLGYNYRLSDIHASLGLNQLKNLEKFIKKRKDLSKIYDDNLDKKKFLPLSVNKNVKSGFHIYVIRIIDKKIIRKKVMNLLKSKNIGFQIHYMPIHLHPFYKKIGFKNGNFLNSEKFSKEILTLPLHTLLTKKEILKVTNLLNNL